MRRVLVVVFSAAAAAVVSAPPASADPGCDTHVHAGGVTVTAAPRPYRHEGVTVLYCNDPAPSCQGVVFGPAVSVPGVVWVDPLVVNNCPL